MQNNKIKNYTQYVTPQEKTGLLERLEAVLSSAGDLAAYKSVMGFDGYVDHLYSVVKQRRSRDSYELFDTLAQFSQRVSNAVRVSADNEIIEKFVRAGGNAVLTAHSLASMGAKVQCIGLFGAKALDERFKEIGQLCPLKSIGDPAQTFALEFSDGKLMFGQLDSLHSLDWERLINPEYGLKLEKSIRDSKLVGLFNWAATLQMTDILKRLIEDVLPFMGAVNLREKIFFFDLSDISARSIEDFLEFSGLLTALSGKSRVVLSLNENEARSASEFLGINPGEEERPGDALREKLGVSQVVVHALKSATGSVAGASCEVEGYFVKNPLITTGAGDNFNGGLCAGLLLGLPLDGQLMLANAAASYYVYAGESGSIEKILAYLKEKAERKM